MNINNKNSTSDMSEEKIKMTSDEKIQNIAINAQCTNANKTNSLHKKDNSINPKNISKGSDGLINFNVKNKTSFKITEDAKNKSIIDNKKSKEPRNVNIKSNLKNNRQTPAITTHVVDTTPKKDKNKHNLGDTKISSGIFKKVCETQPHNTKSMVTNSIHNSSKGPSQIYNNKSNTINKTKDIQSKVDNAKTRPIESQNIQDTKEEGLITEKKINTFTLSPTDSLKEGFSNLCDDEKDNIEKAKRSGQILEAIFQKLQLNSAQNKLAPKLLERLQSEIKRTSDVAKIRDAEWANFNLQDNVLKALLDMKFPYPSPVQVHSIPLVMDGYDLCARAKNGTGKTLSFVIPIHDAIEKAPCVLNQALVMAPTRELAMQIGKVFRKVGAYCRVEAITTFGGSNYHEDIIRIRNGVGVIVGTPGRLFDLIRKKVIKIENFRYIVLDEADKLLSKEFSGDIEEIIERFLQGQKRRANEDSGISSTPEDSVISRNNTKSGHLDLGKHYNTKQNNRNIIKDGDCETLPDVFRKQILLFSATFPIQISSFVKSYMTNLRELNLMPELTLKGISQFYVKVQDEQKLHCLKTLLSKIKFSKCVVFCNHIGSAEKLGFRVVEMGMPCYFLHSRMTVEDRKNIFHQFTTTEDIQILIATDLITRGIDVPEVNCVINFDFPGTVESYLHRIGRAGRFGRFGCALNMCDDAELGEMVWIEKQTGVEIKPVSGEEFKKFMK